MTETFLLIESNSVKENSFMALKHIAFGCAAVMAAAGRHIQLHCQRPDDH